MNGDNDDGQGEKGEEVLKDVAERDSKDGNFNVYFVCAARHALCYAFFLSNPRLAELCMCTACSGGNVNDKNVI